MNARKSTRRSTLRSIALVSVVCLAGSASALASDPHSSRSLTVHYSDLNLSSLAGATTLYQRISGAARFVCGEQGRRFDEQRRWNACYKSAIADAVATVNNPLLASVQNGAVNVTAMIRK